MIFAKYYSYHISKAKKKRTCKLPFGDIRKMTFFQTESAGLLVEYMLPILGL